MKSNKNYLVPILFLGTFGILCTETGIIGILPQIAARFGIDLAQAGLLVSLFALAVAVSGATLPAALSRVNRKTMMLVVLGAFALGNVVFAFAPTFEVALAARVLPAFLHPVYCSAAFALAAASVSESEAPKATSKVMMGVSLGMVVGVPLSSLLANALSVQAVMIAFALINVVTFIGTLLLVPSMPVAQKMSYAQQVSSVKSPLAVASLAATAFIQAAIFATYAYVAEYLGDVMGIEGNAQSALLLGFGVASLLGNYLAGRLLSKAARATLLAFPVAVLAVYLLLYFGADVFPLAVAAVVVWGLAYGFGNNVQQFATSTSMPDAPDFANGLFISFGNIGITLGTAVGGAALAAFGPQATVGASVAFVVLSAASLVVRSRLVRNRG
ncbi:MFS transporter [Gordonibacter sp. 28C]|uniref:MFS transporter n=1 Tax=Gordonibacter sp. 28C TaxID=2078569 RepID=UPI000DF7F306|nr:MFS transporter [Gordonibacter sp. 28C]RDB64317.1 MFS transporter [Gordonibacter sp. 28C]